MKYVAYNEYQPSGADWLGEVPAHWTVKAIKWESPVLRGASPRPIDDPIYFDDDGEYAWVRISDVTEAGTYLENTEQKLSDAGARLSVKLKPGDLFLSIAGSVGKPCITRIKCCIHDGFVYFPRWKADPKFLYYLFASGEPYKGLGKMGTQLNLNTDTVGSIVIGLPEAEEQQTIARFLDAKTAQIDALVAQKRLLIAKLKEKRSALIARAVTRGLPPEAAKAVGLEPHPEMKDSGVDWLGEIPAHWEATQLKRTWAICEYGISESLSGEGDIRVLTMGNIQDGRVTLPSAGCLENVLENMLLHDGDLLFNRTNSLAHVGKVGLYRPDGKGPVSFASYLVRIRPNSRTTPEFMTYLLNIPQLLSFARGLALPSINQANLNPTRYGQIHVALPPIQEQHMILEYVDREASKVDRLTSEVEIAVNRLTEYRQALITSAVTGKIDVRNWQSELEAA